MPQSPSNVTSASGESPCTIEPFGKQSWDAEEAVQSVARPSLSLLRRTCPGMLGVLQPAASMSQDEVVFCAEKGGIEECRRTPNLSFQPPTLPFDRKMKTEEVLEALAKDGATLRLDDLPTLGSPSLGDAEHSQYFLPFLPLPLPPSALPLAGPHFEDDEDGSEKQSVLEWPGFLQKLQTCSRWQLSFLQPFAGLY